MARSFPFSGKHQSFEEIALFRLDAEAGLRLQFSEGNPDFSNRFAFLTEEELNKARRERLTELDILTSLAILTAIEAKFRVDFHMRVMLRKRDSLSRLFRQVDKGRGDRSRLDEDILEGWKSEHPAHARAIADIKGALKYRHWLAHGRYWDPKLARATYDFAAVYAVALLIDQMPMMDFR